MKKNILKKFYKEETKEPAHKVHKPKKAKGPHKAKSPKGPHKAKSPKGPKAPGKIAKVMHEFKEGSLRSGSKKGPKVTNRKQGIAIALSEARKAAK